MKRTTLSFIALFLVGCAEVGGGTVDSLTPLELKPVSSGPVTVVITAPASTTTTTTVAPTTTTTVSVEDLRIIHGQCGEWHDLAISVGFNEEDWKVLSRILYRESRCQPDAWNGWDAGLAQINQIHKEWLSQIGWKHPEDMFNPENNLRFAYMLYQSSGWKPWKATSGL